MTTNTDLRQPSPPPPSQAVASEFVGYLEQRRQKAQNVAFFALCCVFIVTTLFRGNGFQSEWLHSLVYALPAVGVFLVMLFSSRHSPSLMLGAEFKRFLRPHFLLLFFLILQTVIFHFQSALEISRFSQEAVFLIAPISFAITLFALANRQRARYTVHILLIAAIAGYIAERGDELVSGIQQLSLISTFLAPLKLSTESNAFTFMFGFLFIFLLGQRRWLVALITLVFCVLGFKRISYGALAVGLMAYFIASQLSGRWKMIAKLVPVSAVVINLAVIFFIFQFAHGTYDSFFSSTLGVSADYFSQGRENLWDSIMTGLNVDWNTTPVTGLGLGATSHYLETINYHLVNPHSDLLKVFIESGAIVFVLLIYLFYRWGSFSPLAFALTAYMNVNWITDNSFIYFQVMVTYYVLIMYIMLFEKRPTPDSSPPEAAVNGTLPSPSAQQPRG